MTLKMLGAPTRSMMELPPMVKLQKLNLLPKRVVKKKRESDQPRMKSQGMLLNSRH